MSRHTSWHVGGPAEVFFNPRDRSDLAAFLRALPDDVPIHWVGLGSNLLVRDGGLPRRRDFDARHARPARAPRARPRCTAEAGVACARVAKQCIKWGLGPAEFFAGIPGTVGGALAMNAGAFGGETWRHVVEVETIDRHGRDAHAPGERIPGRLSARRRARAGRMVPRREAHLRAASPARNEADVRALLSKRKASQPIGEWSCGSVFTNPPQRSRRAPHRSGGAQGLPHRRCVGVAEAREFHHQPRRGARRRHRAADRARAGDGGARARRASPP